MSWPVGLGWVGRWPRLMSGMSDCNFLGPPRMCFDGRCIVARSYVSSPVLAGSHIILVFFVASYSFCWVGGGSLNVDFWR